MTRRLRVGLLSPEWPNQHHDSGGVAHYAYRLAAELASLVDLTIVTLAGADPLPGAHMVHLPRSPSRLSRYYATPLRARHVVSRLEIDLLHAFGDDWALRHPGAPVVRTFLGSSLHEARSSSGLRRYNHYLLSALEHVSARRADVRLAIGADSEREFDCHYLVPPVVRTPRIGEVPRSPSPRIVFVGTFAGRKRGWLAERLADDAAQALGRTVEFVAVAPTSDRHRWSSTTTVVSGAEDDDVMRQIAGAWLLVAPSTYEGFGIPAFEALSVGVRVVARSNPGSAYIGSLVQNDRILATCDSDAELLPAVIRAIESGPQLSAAESAVATDVVERLIERGSPTFLVETVYPGAMQALRLDARRASPTGR